MRTRQKIAAAGIAGVLSITGIAVLSAPVASAVTTTEDGATTLTDRVQAIAAALAGLVTDGTLTQAQADRVATTLGESDVLRGHGHGHGHGHGGRGGVDLTAAAEALGMSTDELRTALGVEGTTLADVAAEQGVATSALVDALVAAGTERATQAVEEGRLTQAEADEKIAALPERVAALVEQELRGRGGFGHGPHGGARGAADGDAPQDGTVQDSLTAPSA